MRAAEEKPLRAALGELREVARDFRRVDNPGLRANAERIAGIADRLQAVLEPVRDKPAEKKLPASWGMRPRSPFFSEEQDQYIVETGGDYRNLERLAGHFGYPVTALHRRWLAIKVFAE